MWKNFGLFNEASAVLCKSAERWTIATNERESFEFKDSKEFFFYCLIDQRVISKSFDQGTKQFQSEVIGVRFLFACRFKRSLSDLKIPTNFRRLTKVLLLLCKFVCTILTSQCSDTMHTEGTNV
ncbi:hypothetical protein WN51_10909 [Melipona quadrifasciata]|uniref:Uncharacterized protein n=1 Tax=Melipona quadrifasciata TaxID=166423 RepID=A0A0M9A751_9HYME|nr:hypothetical protein WN51_10909 [Melipona quadrifasciata]